MARKTYEEILETVEILPEWQRAADKIKASFDVHFDEYDEVSQATGVPTEILCALHFMEGSGSFKTHLANGDKLSARTIHVPKGLPKTGNPPFSWSEGAIAAVEHDGLDKFPWGEDLREDLAKIEAYNGMGYKKHNRNSQYLVSGTQFCEPGRYVADGIWDEYAESSQIGVIPILIILGYIE